MHIDAQIRPDFGLLYMACNLGCGIRFKPRNPSDIGFRPICLQNVKQGDLAMAAFIKMNDSTTTLGMWGQTGLGLGLFSAVRNVVILA